MSNTIFATLPRELVIDNLTHVLHWKTKRHAIYQSYTTPIKHDGENILSPQIAGQNEFLVFEIVPHYPDGESFGELCGTYTDLQPAMTAIERLEQFA